MLLFSSRTSSEKRYLIVTYVAAFDRIHYPLPLPVCDEPTTEMLKRTVQRLLTRGGARAALPSSKAEKAPKNLLELRREIEQLRIERDKALTEVDAVNGMLKDLKKQVAGA